MCGAVKPGTRLAQVMAGDGRYSRSDGYNRAGRREGRSIRRTGDQQKLPDSRVDLLRLSQSSVQSVDGDLGGHACWDAVCVASPKLLHGTMG